MESTNSVLEQEWSVLLSELKERFGKEPDLNAILMLIGIRELGQVKPKWTKEEKVNLMHIAVCRLLSDEGFYELEGLDADGWPHWKLARKLPFINMMEQEIYLKQQVVAYFNAL